MDSIRISAFYLEDVVERLDSLIERAQTRLAANPVDFDTLVGTGLSGALVVPRIADALGVNWLMARKPNDGTHSSKRVEGSIGRRWLFVDDLIDSGLTLKRAIAAVEAETASRKWRTSFVGSYLYLDGEFRDAGNSLASIDRHV